MAAAGGGQAADESIQRRGQHNRHGTERDLHVVAVGTRMLRNPRSGRCLDAINGGTTDGTRIQLCNCVVTTSAQKWTYIAPLR